MKKHNGHQKIKCTVADCSHNCTQDSTCLLHEIAVCNCHHDKTKDPLKDTACSSYEYSESKHIENL